VELILLVCLTIAPTSCTEQKIAFFDSAHEKFCPIAGMFAAAKYVADAEEQGRSVIVKEYFCRPPGRPA
jgi:hypothetical protein